MNTWKYSNKRKVHQRYINRHVRQMNKNIYNDSLWKGRFIVKQKDARFMRYSDGSGSYLYVLLQFIDQLTGKTYEKWDIVNGWCMWHGASIWETMNWFITEYCDVWRKEDPRTQNYDFRKEGK